MRTRVADLGGAAQGDPAASVVHRTLKGVSSDDDDGGDGDESLTGSEGDSFSDGSGGGGGGGGGDSSMDAGGDDVSVGERRKGPDVPGETADEGRPTSPPPQKAQKSCVIS
jgi:hypothetical protein